MKITSAAALKKALTKIRTSQGVSKYALAKRLGVDRARISAMETGPSVPSFISCQRFAKELGYEFTADFLFKKSSLKK